MLLTCCVTGVEREYKSATPPQKPGDEFYMAWWSGSTHYVAIGEVIKSRAIPPAPDCIRVRMGKCHWYYNHDTENYQYVEPV